jgi:organic hydroperoxide reductase OsmC/OhrA
MSAANVALHTYTARIEWTGNLGSGTSAYTAYSRRHRIAISGKPALICSADPGFRGDAEFYNPEELFIASLSACHMLFFLSLCSREGIRVTAYEDAAQGSLELRDEGGGRFAEITLRPVITVADEHAVEHANRLNETAHRLCFIANSCRAPVRVEPTIHVQQEGRTDGSGQARCADG